MKKIFKKVFWRGFFEKSFSRVLFENFSIRAVGLLILVLACSMPAFGYVLERTNSGNPLLWDLTRNDDKVQGGRVRYYLNKDCSSDFADVNQCLDILRNSFAQWSGIPTSLIDFSEAGTTSASQTGYDDINLLVFVTGDPELSGGVIALTTTFFNPLTGEIVDSDIRFNDEDFDFTADTSLQAVATHEIGHFFGLDHSFLGYLGPTLEESLAATMYPFYFDECATLEWDDKAGASELYPEPLLFDDYGILSGKVTEETETSDNILGAHISLLNPASGVPIVAGVSGKDGTYQIYGCPPGDYVVLAEPPPLNPAVHWGPYYAAAPTDYSPILYNAHEFDDFTEALPGSETFDSAERVSITAQNETSGINFVVNASSAPPPPPPPPPLASSGGGGDSGGLFGCSTGGWAVSFDFGWLLLFTPYIWRVFVGIRKNKKGSAALRF